MDLELHPFQPGWRHVDRIHRRRQVDGDRERGLVLDEGRPLAPEGRAGGGKRAERDHDRRQMDRPEPARAIAVHHQMSEQVGRDQPLPQAPDIAAPQRQPDEEERDRNAEQPPGPEEVKVGNHRAGTVARRPSAAAAQAARW